MSRRRNWAHALGAVPVVAASALVSVPGPAVAQGVAQTTQILFPWSASGRLAPQVHVAKRVSGYCWTSSLEVDDFYAWRCMAGNDIYDPCFAPSVDHAAQVLCNDMSPWDTAGILMQLTKPLPLAQAFTAPEWTGFAVQLANKARCVLRDLDHSPPVSDGQVHVLVRQRPFRQPQHQLPALGGLLLGHLRVRRSRFERRNPYRRRDSLL